MSAAASGVPVADRNGLPAIAGLSFEVSRLLSARCAWLSPRLALPGWPADEEGRARHCAHDFGYAIPGGKAMDALPFDTTDVRSYWAERYGGNGLSGNGGGVRVGNHGGYQIKGIGQNPLVGAAASVMHSYGGLTASEACYEAIYTHVLDCVLPLGAVPVLAVLTTGPGAALSRHEPHQPDAADQWRCWGALLVRGLSRRPSHFLRSPGYVAPAAGPARLAPDVARVRAVNRALLAEFGSANGYMLHLGQFLQAAANQFALARIAGIAHGALSPSNIASDGRWLDLARTTFVTRGEDNGYFLPFLSERNAPLLILRELADTFAKYTGQRLHVAALGKYYQDQFEAHTDAHLAYLFGIEGFAPAGAAYDVLVAQMRLALAAPAPRVATPAEGRRGDDPFTVLVESLFRSLDANAAPPPVAAGGPPGVERAVAGAALAAVLRAIEPQAGRAVAGYRSLLVRCAALALKRALLPEFFYKRRLDDHLRAMSHSRPEGYGELLRDAIDIAQWGLTDQLDGPLVLYRCGAFQVWYDARQGNWGVGAQRDLANAGAVRRALAATPPALLARAGFDFAPYLCRILNTLELLERCDG